MMAETATMPAVVTKMLEAKPRYGLTTSTLWMAYIGNRYSTMAMIVPESDWISDSTEGLTMAAIQAVNTTNPMTP